MSRNEAESTPVDPDVSHQTTTTQSYETMLPTVEVTTTGAGYRVKLVHPLTTSLYVPAASKAEAEKLAADLSNMMALAYHAGQVK